MRLAHFLLDLCDPQVFHHVVHVDHAVREDEAEQNVENSPIQVLERDVVHHEGHEGKHHSSSDEDHQEELLVFAPQNAPNEVSIHQNHYVKAKRKQQGHHLVLYFRIARVKTRYLLSEEEHEQGYASIRHVCIPKQKALYSDALWELHSVYEVVEFRSYYLRLGTSQQNQVLHEVLKDHPRAGRYDVVQAGNEKGAQFKRHNFPIDSQ